MANPNPPWPQAGASGDAGRPVQWQRLETPATKRAAERELHHPPQRGFQWSGVGNADGSAGTDVVQINKALVNAGKTGNVQVSSAAPLGWMPAERCAERSHLQALHALRVVWSVVYGRWPEAAAVRGMMQMRHATTTLAARLTSALPAAARIRPRVARGGCVCGDGA